MSPTITSEVVQVEHVDDKARFTSMVLMVEHTIDSVFVTSIVLMVEMKEDSGFIKVNMNAQMQEMRGGMNG